MSKPPHRERNRTEKELWMTRAARPHAWCRYIVGAYVNMRAEEAGALASGADPGAQVLKSQRWNRLAVVYF